jgi:hypothetical protein
VPAVTDTGFVPMRVSKVTALGRAVGDDVAFYRSSDALSLAVLLGTPIFVAPEMLDDCARRMEGDSPEALLARRPEIRLSNSSGYIRYNA